MEEKKPRKKTDLHHPEKSARKLRIQDDDITVLEYLRYRYRLLTTKQIVDILGPGKRTKKEGHVLGEHWEQHRKRRLRILSGHNLDGHKWLARIPVKTDEYYDYRRHVPVNSRQDRSKGDVPLVYAITNEGADAHGKETGDPRGKKDWDRLNRNLKNTSWRHMLFNSAVVLHLELACRNHPNIVFGSRREIIGDDEKKLTVGAMVGKGSADGLQDEGMMKTKMDDLFSITFLDLPTGDGGHADLHFFVEADRDTEAMVWHPKQKTFRISSLKKDRKYYFFEKLLTYNAVHRTKEHEKQLGIGRFFVLTVTTSKDRVRSMVKTAQRVKKPRTIFLFVDFESFKSGDPLTMPWTNGRGFPFRIAAPFQVEAQASGTPEKFSVEVRLAFQCWPCRKVLRISRPDKVGVGGQVSCASCGKSTFTITESALADWRQARGVISEKLAATVCPKHQKLFAPGVSLDQLAGGHRACCRSLTTELESRL